MSNEVPFSTTDEFFIAVDKRYDDLSKRLQTIARELRFHSDSIALMSVNELAIIIDVAPSALVRFAQSMGFSGFSQMKALFQQNLAEKISGNSYAQRIQKINKEQQKVVESIPGSVIVSEVVNNNIHSLQELFTPQLIQELNDAVTLMQESKAIWVMAAGRSFAAAAYFTYLVRHGDKPIHWLDGLSFDTEGQMHTIQADDVFIVVSYYPYSKASLQAIEIAKNNGAQIITLTDSHMNEVSKQSTQSIEVREHSSFGFRSLVNTVCVIQSLFLLYASHAELPQQEQN